MPVSALNKSTAASSNQGLAICACVAGLWLDGCPCRGACISSSMSLRANLATNAQLHHFCALQNLAPSEHSAQTANTTEAGSHPCFCMDSYKKCSTCFWKVILFNEMQWMPTCSAPSVRLAVTVCLSAGKQCPSDQANTQTSRIPSHCFMLRWCPDL